MSQYKFRVAKGVRSQLCEAPFGPFRQLTPDPLTENQGVTEY